MTDPTEGQHRTRDSKKKICVLCKKEFTEYGNNPWPLADLPDRCCDECNRNYVVPARIRGTR